MKISILAGDLRQYFIEQTLKLHGYDTKYAYNFEESDIFVTPVPFTRDGIHINAMLKDDLTIDGFIDKLNKNNIVFSGSIPEWVSEKLTLKGIGHHDHLSDSQIVVKNALFTAEGLLSEIITHTPFSLVCANVLIIGYGRCGKAAADILGRLCNSINVYDHTESNLVRVQNDGYNVVRHEELSTSLSRFNVIINTVPEIVLTSAHLEKADTKALFFEIASSPYGFHKDIFEKHNLQLITCPGIPGKYTPQTAGEIISEYIIKHIERNEQNDS